MRCKYCFDDHDKKDCKGLTNLITLIKRRAVHSIYIFEWVPIRSKEDEILAWFKDKNGELGEKIGCSRAALRYAHNQNIKDAPQLFKYEFYPTLSWSLPCDGFSYTEILEMYFDAGIGDAPR